MKKKVRVHLLATESIDYYINGKTGKKVWGTVTEINYGHKKGVQLKIKPFKK